MIWKQRREIRREPTRNKGIHLVISVSFVVRLLMQFIRREELNFLRWLAYLHKSLTHAAGRRSPQITKYSTIIHLATNH